MCNCNFLLFFLGQALFERVLLSQEDLLKAVLIDGSKVDKNGHVVQPKVLHYLAECYLRCHNRQNMLQKRVSRNEHSYF